MEDLQLDIVGFLALLGEGAVLATSPVSFLTWLCFVPHLIPAPQALFRPNRPRGLPTTRAWVTGVFNGSNRDHLYHFADVRLYAIFSCPQTRKRSLKRCLRAKGRRAKGRDLKPYEVRCVRIEYSGKHSGSSKPNITARVRGPLLWLTMGGFTISVLLLVISAVYRDGMSVCATLSLSGLSTLSGLANSCKLKLPRRKDPYEEEPAPQPRDGNRERRPPPVPPGDTVIRYPNGSFIIIKCEEDVARELFFAPEELEYRVADEKWYRFLSLIGTVLLMAGILFLANATLPLQIGWALAYGLINVGYWIVAGISPRRHWDFSSYTMREVGLASDEIKEGGRETRPSFTLALWKAIVLTKNTSWVKHSDAAPRTVA